MEGKLLVSRAAVLHAICSPMRRQTGIQKTARTTQLQLLRQMEARCPSSPVLMIVHCMQGSLCERLISQPPILDAWQTAVGDFLIGPSSISISPQAQLLRRQMSLPKVSFHVDLKRQSAVQTFSPATTSSNQEYIELCYSILIIITKRCQFFLSRLSVF